MTSTRTFLPAANAAGKLDLLDPALPAGLREGAILDALPGKVPLIKLSFRPPNYETPVSYLNTLYTPNDAFFVRYHLADIPQVDAKTWRLKIGGEAAAKPYELTLDQLKTEFPGVEITAVCQCSGNRRGLFNPHVPGVQWGYGAIGNARWKGARLKDVLERAGIAKDAIEVVFDGADGPVLEKTPDFVKSLPLWKAVEETALIAYEMNGEPLPHFNGYPARIIVPGWTATYWIKHVVLIEVRKTPFDGFWVKTAYRVPNGKFPTVQRFISQETAANTPITEMVVNSMITNLVEGQKVRAGATLEVKGIAWDADYGIQAVDVSSDAGKTWRAATLGEDAGRFSFRPWSFAVEHGPGPHVLMARAANKVGQVQTAELIPNPAGYNHNVMHRHHSYLRERRAMRAVVCATVLATALVGPVFAAEEPIPLRAGPGKEVVETNCASCHSLDYIAMNAAFLSAKIWEVEVTKMIKVFGAPIDEADAKKIVDYLNAAYGG